jgi:hypothetical protein
MASYSPRKSTIFEFQRGQWPNRTRFGGAIDHADIFSAGSLTLLKFILISAYNIFSSIKKVWEIYTSFFISAGSFSHAVTDFDHFRSAFLSEYEALCENAFSLLIRDLYGVDWWKKLESKISCHCPFNVIIVLYPKSTPWVKFPMIPEARKVCYKLSCANKIIFPFSISSIEVIRVSEAGKRNWNNLPQFPTNLQER